MTHVQATRHVLAVNDLAGMAAYFMDVLGFSRDMVVDGWEFLSLDGFRVMLGECPGEVPAAEAGNHAYFAHVLVDDVDALCRSMKSRGAAITHDIETKPWGLREFYVATPEGHRMGFAQELDLEL